MFFDNKMITEMPHTENKATTKAEAISKLLSGYHADTPITIKAEASSKADSHPN